MKNFSTFTLLKDNLISNLKEFRLFRPKIKICAVVKANAYGMGLNGVAGVLSSLVDFFGVTNEQEALSLRKLTTKPILLLSRVNAEMIGCCLKHHISLSVSSVVELEQILWVAERMKVMANIHLKVNSGMNRLGFSDLPEYQKALQMVFHNNSLYLEGIFTHFGDGANRERSEQQFKRFQTFLKLGKERDTIIHAAATNAALFDPKYCFDMVRLGLLLYGYSETKPPFPLLPVCQIKSKIICMQQVKAGEWVGYGNGYLAKKDRMVAVVPVGYADGYMRSLSNRAHVLIGGKKCKVIGRVCMDLFLVDITEVNCKVLDDVILLGSDGKHTIDANDLAKWGKTIPYEVLTNIKTERFDYRVE